MPQLLYDQSQIIAWLGSHTVEKARSYLHAVSRVEWGKNSLSGSVQGSERLPYVVQAHFRVERHRLVVNGECTCPVGFNCKHVAALLMTGLRVDEQPAPARPAPVRPELLRWLEEFHAKHGRSTRRAPKPKVSVGLVYVIGTGFRGGPEVCLYKARLRADGSVGAIEDPWNNVEAALVRPLKFLNDEDLSILRGLWFGRAREDYGGLALRGAAGAMLVGKIIATGRAFAGSSTDPPAHPRELRLGSARAARVDWRSQSSGRLRCVLVTEPPSSLTLSTEPFWYVDEHSGEAGPIECPGSTQPIADLLAMPAISLAEAPLVGAMLRDIAPSVPLPPAHDHSALRVIDTEPVPVLTLKSVPTYGSGWSGTADRVLDFAALQFDYGQLLIAGPAESPLHRTPAGEVVHLKRRPESEQRRRLELRATGLQKIPLHLVYTGHTVPDDALGFAEPGDWPGFVAETLPSLRGSGWRCVMAPEFRFNVIVIDAIDGSVTAAGDGWFDLAMGIQVGDRTVPLEPLLRDLFGRDARWLSGGLDTIADDEPIDLTTDRGERLRLRAHRIKPLVRILIDLFDADRTPGSALRIGPWDAGRLEALEDLGRWQFQGDSAVRELAQRLRAGPGMRPVPVPRELKAHLREYQRQGLNWLQFLRAQDLGGVLADDMGLGKTVQALAHILVEYEYGRLDRPVLIVAPTSLIPNWRAEAERFAPILRVLDLHGATRKDRFERIGKHHVVLTTYALLWRDHERLAEHEYHLLILDESQNVKNAATKAAAAIRSLKAQHRLCLTGTPLENHLGELWALFDFLLPGFLGTQKDFTQRWRTPIEKHGDAVRRDLLARRIRPFMLRRLKDEVAGELPPKTTIVRTVELAGAQRDLYEAVRSAMQERVRTAITAQGLARSHILVLDALLKLRQVCCDPRLVKLGSATRTEESSKLELLLEMVPELIDEGRRILLFSQFTGMLTLIAAAFDAAGIGYMTLTGDTADRATPVTRFERGEAPVFLISLKAGGVGLNLTSADTVIHYDPWWNPAAENQATDRAHRLGQTKPVFVYKLVAAGSIEEKIIALQGRKAALADMILSDNPASAVKFSDQDIEALFAPLPTLPASA